MTREEAHELEKRLRKAIFKQVDLAAPSDKAEPALADTEARDQWLMIANLLLSATGIQPRPGVYFLCQAGKLVYIGQSKNVACRLAGHRGKGYDQAVMIEVPVADLTSTERYLIKMLRPALNAQRGPG